MSSLSIDMSQQPSTCRIFPHPIHVRLLELHSCPRLDQFSKSALPSSFEIPWDLDETFLCARLIELSMGFQSI